MLETEKTANQIAVSSICGDSESAASTIPRDLRAELRGDLLARIVEIESDKYRLTESYVTGPEVWRSIAFYAAASIFIWIAVAVVYIVL